MSEITSANPAAAEVVKELSGGQPISQDILDNPEAYRPQTAGQQNAPVARKTRKAKRPTPAAAEGLDLDNPAIKALLARVEALEAANRPTDEPEVEVFGSVLPGEEKVLKHRVRVEGGRTEEFEVLRREN